MSRSSRAVPLIAASVLALAAGVFCRGGGERERALEGEILTTRTLGLAYLEENRLDEAAAAFRKLTTLAPKEPLGYANLGLTYLRQGNYPEAERSIRQAVKLNPKDPDIRLMLAKVLELTQRAPEAREVLEGTVGDAPEHLKSWYALAQISADPNDPEARRRREQYLERLVGLAPANAAARVLLIDILLKNAKADAALAQAEQLHAQIPELPPQAQPFFDAAVEQMRAGRAAEAQRPMLIVSNFLRATGAYQAGISNLEGPGGVLLGFPLVTLSRPTGEEPSPEAVLAALRFTDATASTGLARVILSASPDVYFAVGDYDGDGDPDLYLGGAGRNQLLRNDAGAFTDVTAESGIHPGASTAAIFGDYDNDGRLDLYVARRGSDLLYHNQGDGTFRDVTRAAGLQGSSTTYAPLFLDADQDGDLDLYLAGPGPNRLLRNNGDGTFVEMARRMGLAGGPGTSRAAAFGDFDDDAGLDLVVANERTGATQYHNLLEGRFQDVTAQSGLASGAGAVALAVGDYNNDGLLDVFVAGAGPGTARLYFNRGDGSFERDERPTEMLRALSDFSVKQATFFDFDNDGWLDLVVAGSSREGTRGALLFRNAAAGRFDDLSARLPHDAGSARQVAVLDYDGDGDPDLLVAREDGTVRLLRNDGGDANHYLKLQLTGLRVAGSKNNYYGIGAKIEMRAGGMYQTRVVTEPVTYLGLGRQLKADVLRIVWTNGVPQNVFSPTGDQRLVEEQVLKGSCPFLYAWNGRRFEFVTDVMWRSALGMPMDIMGGGKGYAPAASSREYIRIPGEALKPRGDAYLIQVTGELWETGYLDQVQLLVVDHPDSLQVLLDERFVPPGDPSLRIYQVTRPRTPVSATDDQGRNLLPLLKDRDDRYVSQFKLGRFQGLTQTHDLVLDPGPLPPTDDVTLFLNGWIFPTDASINVALSQSAGEKPFPPQVQVMGPDGAWHTVITDMGFPSGKAKTVVVDLAGKFLSRDRRVRIRTNMQIYWDQAFFTTGDVRGPAPQGTLAPVAADVHYRGFSRMYRQGGRYGPFWFDYAEVDRQPRWLPLRGRFTRYGDVLDLLRQADDRYVVFGPGDEITVSFPANGLPPLPSGWRRDFLLYSDSWLKDADLHTGTGQTVEPLPFHGMPHYPYGAEARYPGDPEHQQFVSRYLTRRITQVR